MTDYQIRFRYIKGARTRDSIGVTPGATEAEARTEAMAFSTTRAGRQVWLELDNTVIATYKDGQPNKVRTKKPPPVPEQFPESDRWFPIISTLTTRELAEAVTERIGGSVEDNMEAVQVEARRVHLHTVPKWKARAAGKDGAECWFGRDANLIAYNLWAVRTS